MSAPLGPAPGEREASGIVALSGLSVLVLARWLEPDPAGHSTHRQLGLPPCTFFDLTGVPCPMCGGTTTFALLADGRVGEALGTQPFAALLFVGLLLAIGVSVAEVVLPRGRWSRISARLLPYEAYIAAMFLGAMTAGWAYKVWMVLG